MTVRELLERIDSRELSEWMAYYHIKGEPPPQDPEVTVSQIRSILGG